MRPIERYIIGSILGCLLLLSIGFEFNWFTEPQMVPVRVYVDSRTATEAVQAASSICRDLLKMYEANPTDAVAALGIVRCAVLEVSLQQRENPQ